MRDALETVRSSPSSMMYLGSDRHDDDMTNLDHVARHLAASQQHISSMASGDWRGPKVRGDMIQ
eukprot:2586608-Prymnesium_polylepis.1